ncbi:MAG: extracellular solute-binding protein, partial [Micrococcales bacterium]|nr:extracellular solute-binding protein [Micrococcales bacterium]
MSRTRRFTGAAIAVATLSALALAGCSSGSGSPSAGGSAGPSGNVTWTSWGDAGEIAIMKQFTSDFNKSHPNIKVTFQPGADYSSYHPKLLTQLSANKAPDVFYIGDDNIGSFVSANVLEPLDSYLAEPSSAVSQSDFYPGLFGAAQQGTTIFGIPNDSNPDAFWYDKTALQKAGITQDPATLAANDQWTLATFLDMCQKLHAAGLMGAGFWNYWSTTYSWLSVNDAPAWDGDTFAAAT